MTTTLEVFRGDDVPITVTISETVGGVKEPFDLTGATITATIGGTPGWSGTPAVLSAIAGTCEVQVPAATMATFSPGTYPIDIQVVKGGLKRTAVLFAIRVVADLTLS